jgi:hypothetical protein
MTMALQESQDLRPAHPSLLSGAATTPSQPGEQQNDRSFARDLNLDQLIAAIAGQREERDLITRVLFVSHRFGFAEHFRREQAHSTLFLRAERQTDGQRTYKLAGKEPLPTSYGEDLYYQLGGWLPEDESAARQ